MPKCAGKTALFEGRAPPCGAAAAAAVTASSRPRRIIAAHMLVLINLESAELRRAAMTRQLQALGCPFLRIGVDLRRVGDAAVDEALRCRFPELRFDRRVLSNAEIGCWLSHLSAWQLLLRADAPATATVIEDDLRLAAGFARAIDALRARDRFDVVFLGTSSRNLSTRRRSMIHGHAVHQPVGAIFNTWGYSISRAYARRFFSRPPRRIALPIDHFLGGRGGAERPSIGVLQPAVVEEDAALAAASQIGPHTRRLDRAPWFQRARRRLLASTVSEIYYSLYRYL
jgi:glycosyl transferase family 25